MNMFEKLVPGSATLTSKWVNTIGKEQTDFDQDVYETDQFVKFITGFGFNPLNKEYMENAYVYKVRKLSKQKNNLGSRWQSAALDNQFGIDTVINQYIKANKNYYKVYTQLHNLSNASRTLGINPNLLLKDSGFNRDTRRNVASSNVKYFIPLPISDDFRKKLYEERPTSEARVVYKELIKINRELNGLPLLINENIYKVDKDKNPFKNKKDVNVEEKFNRLQRKTGGLVPNVKEDPADRKNPFTGEPYQAKDTLDEQMDELFDRENFAIGGIVSKVAKQLTKSQKKNLVDGDYVYHFTSKANAEKIKKEGLNPLKTSNFVKAGTGERYQDSPAVYAFKNPADAVAFAKKHYWRSEDFENLALIKIKKSDYKWEPDQAPDIQSLFGPEGLEKLNIKYDKKEVIDLATNKILDTYDDYLPSIKFSGGVIKSKDIVDVKSMEDIEKAFKDPTEFRGYSRHNENWPDVEGNPYGFAKIIADVFENKR